MRVREKEGGAGEEEGGKPPSLLCYIPGVAAKCIPTPPFLWLFRVFGV